MVARIEPLKWTKQGLQTEVTTVMVQLLCLPSVKRAEEQLDSRMRDLHTETNQ